MRTFTTPVNVQALARIHDLCCGCGVCAAICPQNCIEMRLDENLQYKPFVDCEVCNNCGLCVNVCIENQETNVNVERTFMETHSNSTENRFLGAFFNCYVGHVTRIEDRLASASGGLLTAILEELLRRNFVDAVVVVGESSYERTGKFFDATIVENVEGVHLNRGSKYYPIEYSQVLKEIESKKDRRYAIVALPCTTLAIRKAQLNKKLQNVRYVLSPVCGHGVSAAYTEFLLKSNDISPHSVTKISYRDKTKISKATDYNFVAEYKTAKGTKIKRLGFVSSDVGKIWCNYLFTPTKCFFCKDFAGEVSDASFADAWLPEYSQDVNGTSLMIVRNAEIHSLIKEMVNEDKLHLSSITPEKIMKAQRDALHFKKELIKGRVRFYKLFHQDFPDCGINWRNVSLVAAIRKNWRTMLNAHLSRWLYRKRFLNLIRHLNNLHF